jgi:ankyrin repeat protein
MLDYRRKCNIYDYPSIMAHEAMDPNVDLNVACTFGYDNPSPDSWKHPIPLIHRIIRNKNSRNDTVLEFLLKLPVSRGLDLNVRTFEDVTPIYSAISFDNMKAFKLLYADKRTDLGVLCRGLTLLEIAQKFERTEMLAMLTNKISVFIYNSLYDEESE